MLPINKDSDQKSNNIQKDDSNQISTQKEEFNDNFLSKNDNLFLGKKTHPQNQIEDYSSSQKVQINKCNECNSQEANQKLFKCKFCHNYICNNCIKKYDENGSSIIEDDPEKFCTCRECLLKHKKNENKNLKNFEEIHENTLYKCSICGIKNKNEKDFNFFTISKEQKNVLKNELKKKEVIFFENEENIKDDNEMFPIQICFSCNNIFSDLINSIMNTEIKEEKNQKEKIVDKTINSNSNNKVETNKFKIIDNAPKKINTNINTNKVNENSQKKSCDSNKVNFVLNKNEKFNFNLNDEKVKTNNNNNINNNNLSINSNYSDISNYFDTPLISDSSLANSLLSNILNNINDIQNLNNIINNIDNININNTINTKNDANGNNNKFPLVNNQLNSVKNLNEDKSKLPLYINNQINNITSLNMIGDNIDKSEIKNTFMRITKNLQEFDNNNIENNLSILNCVEKITSTLTEIINDEKNYIINNINIKNKNDNRNNNNDAKSKILEKINYLILITEELKKNMKSMDYYNQMQKFFVDLLFKSLEMFIDKITIEPKNSTLNKVSGDLSQKPQNMQKSNQEVNDKLNSEQFIPKQNLSSSNIYNQINNFVYQSSFNNNKNNPNNNTNNNKSNMNNNINNAMINNKNNIMSNKMNNTKNNKMNSYINNNLSLNGNQTFFNYNNNVNTNPNILQLSNNNTNLSKLNIANLLPINQGYPQNMNIFGDIVKQQHQTFPNSVSQKQQEINYLLYPFPNQNANQIPPLLNNFNGNLNENNIINIQYHSNANNNSDSRF